MTITKNRTSYFDVLRIVAAFLVIVNHTNSRIFIGSTPDEIQWYFSIAWYYISKVAVPIYVMVSGACLLKKQDSYARVFSRIRRILVCLIVFSYMQYLYDAWVFYGLWPRAVDFKTFFLIIYSKPIEGAYWYLYLYTGLLLLLPLLQRFVKSATKKDLQYLMALCFGFNLILPMLSHYVPGLILTSYLSKITPNVFVGLFVLGYYMTTYAKKTSDGKLLVVVLYIATITVSVLLTLLEYYRIPLGEEYWFMDNRTMPSLTIVASSVLFFSFFSKIEWKNKYLISLGKYSFGIYLIHNLIIEKTTVRIYEKLATLITEFPAMLIWEIAVFALALVASWCMHKIPYLKKIL